MATYSRETVNLHGAYPDLIPADAPVEAWNSANNVWFQDGQSRRVPGDTPVFPGHLGGEPLACVFYTNGFGEPYWIYATISGVYALDASGYSDISPAGWAATSDSVITFEAFNGFVTVNDSLGGPFYWSGAIGSPCEDLPAWPGGWRCISLRSHKGFLFAIGRLDMGGQQRVSWSDAAEAGTMPDSWDPDADNLAGFVDLLPAASPCIDGLTIGDDFLVFKGESVHAFTFIGGNDVFGNRKRFSDIGMSTVNGWCKGPNERALFFGSDGDIYATEGIGYVSILDGKAQRTYFADADPDQFGRACAATLFRSELSIMAYPTAGNVRADRAVLFDWRSGDVSFRDMPQISCMAGGRYLVDVTSNSWEDDPDEWNDDEGPWNAQLSPVTADDVVGASVAGFWWLTGTNDETQPLAAYLLKEGLSFGTAQARKLASRIWPKVTGQPGDRLSVRVGGKDAEDGATEWAGAQEFTIGAGQSVDAFIEGRYLSIEVASIDAGEWVFGSVDIEFRHVGGW